QAKARSLRSDRARAEVRSLLEWVALLESNLAEEAKLKAKPQSGPSSKTNDKKRKWDQVDGGKTSGCQPASVSVLSPRTNVLICVLMDSHGHPVCADGHTRTHTDSHERP
ncbi:unnamed protein product, partial [Brassica rapa subsp. narinosa]